MSVKNDGMVALLLSLKTRAEMMVKDFDSMLRDRGYVDPMNDGNFKEEASSIAPTVSSVAQVSRRGRKPGSKNKAKGVTVVHMPANRRVQKDGRSPSGVDWDGIFQRIFNVCAHGDRSVSDMYEGYLGEATLPQFKAAVSKLREDKKLVMHGTRRGATYSLAKNADNHA